VWCVLCVVWCVCVVCVCVVCVYGVWCMCGVCVCVCVCVCVVLVTEHGVLHVLACPLPLNDIFSSISKTLILKFTVFDNL
jgi:hypothetical protein